MKKYLLLVAALLMFATSTLTLASNHKWVTVVNDREFFPIFYIHIAPIGQDTWGPDQLGDQVLNVGESRTWTIKWPGCHVHLRATTFTGLMVTQHNVNVCGGLTWTLQDQ